MVILVKKILITGARSGIAKGVIDSLVNDNFYIYATTRTEKQAISLKKNYCSYNNIECFKLDITKDEDRNKIDNLDFDILFCNAAISNGGSLIEININRLIENYDINVFSNVLLIQKFIRKNLLKNQDSRIIIMSSLAGIVPIEFIGSYSSTKASLIKVAETMKKELKLLNKKIRVCLIEPGFYKTGFNEFMFLNKYGNDNSYFDDEIEYIKKKESIMLTLLSKKRLNSIVKKIRLAITEENPRFIYRAPFFQVVGAKLYNLFFE